MRWCVLQMPLTTMRASWQLLGTGLLAAGCREEEMQNILTQKGIPMRWRSPRTAAACTMHPVATASSLIARLDCACGSHRSGAPVSTPFYAVRVCLLIGWAGDSNVRFCFSCSGSPLKGQLIPVQTVSQRASERGRQHHRMCTPRGGVVPHHMGQFWLFWSDLWITALKECSSDATLVSCR